MGNDFVETLKKQWGKRLIQIGESWYLAGAKPRDGQPEPTHLPNGIPIRLMAWDTYKYERQLLHFLQTAYEDIWRDELPDGTDKD